MAGWASAGLNLKGPKGDTGAPGQSVMIKGSVANAAALPTTGLTNGDGWITSDDGHLHVWSSGSWNDVGLVRGPAGTDGRSITSGTVDGSGNLILTYSDSTTVNVGHVTGATGSTGAAATVTVDAPATLAAGASATVANLGTTSAAILHFGIPQGAKGDQGVQGVQGNTGATGARGSQWWTGHGTPSTVVGSLAGDMYLDVDTGDVYQLS